MPRIPLALRGLRVRLVVSFTCVAVAAVVTTGALTFREARTGLLRQSQDSVVQQFRDSIDSLVPRVPPVADRAGPYLDTLVSRLARSHATQGWVVLATYGDERASSATLKAFDSVTPALRRHVEADTSAVFQRVDAHGVPTLVVGTPVVYTPPGDTVSLRTGLCLYLTVDQDADAKAVQALVTAVERAAVPALVLAVVLALLAARQVLRPVRALRTATRRMAEGHLDVRLDVNGSDELAGLSGAFNDTAAALEKSVSELRLMESKARRFAADVSHELRTPLAAMTAVTGILDEDAPQLDQDTADAVRLISEETQRLTRLVDDLMEISRFDAHTARLNLDDIDLAESLRRTLASRGWLRQVETRLPEPGVLRGRVDPRRLDVIVANLVGNAIRHGAAPVVLSLATHPTEHRDTAVMTVEDGGPGIPEAALPHIFERFYKADTSRARSDSSGLGLAITAENVELHGGSIRAANRPGGGAVFTVELPLRPRGTPTPAAADPDTGETESSPS